MKQKAPYLASLVLSALLALGVMTVFSACGMKDDGTWMHCHDAQLHVLYLALAMAATAFVAVFARNDKARIALCALQAVLAGATFAVPGGISGMCMMASMRCWTVFKPYTSVMCALIAIAAVAGIVAAARRLPKKS